MPSTSARIQAIVPKHYTQFKKLGGGDPYHFSSWEKDSHSILCLYYWFWDSGKTYKMKKRVPLVGN